MKLNYIIEICVAIDIAILGIAYPIIVNQIGKIGDKYNSNYLSVLFSEEYPQKKITRKFPNLSVFKFTFYLTISSLLLLIFSFPPLFKTKNEFIDWIVGNSAEILVFILTVILVILFFRWLDILNTFRFSEISIFLI